MPADARGVTSCATPVQVPVPTIPPGIAPRRRRARVPEPGRSPETRIRLRRPDMPEMARAFALHLPPL